MPIHLSLSGLRFSLAVGVAALVALGCGGGGSGSEPAPLPVVTQPNRAPEADAGGDQSVESGSTVTLDGSGSRDPDGDALDYSWRQTGGPSVELADADSASATFEAPEVEHSGVLRFELDVDDGRGGTDSDEVQVTVRPGPVSVCDRTPQVRDEIVRQAGAADCGSVYLLDVKRLELAGKGIDRVKVGDFAGLRKLSVLDLSRNRLRDLPVGSFDDLANVGYLNLDRNELATLPAGLFVGMWSLGILAIEYNEIAALPEGVFDGPDRLRNLLLVGHRLGVVPTGMFHGLERLASLGLGGEGDVEIVPGVFDGLPNLKELRLSNYRGISSLKLHAGAFAGLPKLEKLHMERAGLTELPAGLFQDVPTLRYLNTSRNKLEVLPDGLFAGLHDLEDLNLRSNRLTDLGNRPFSDLSSLKWLSLRNNHLTRLPDGLFSGLKAIEELDIRWNHGGNFFRFEDGFSVRVGLERVDGDPDAPAPARLRVRVPTAVPYDLTATVDVQNGSSASGEVLVPRGGFDSEEFEVKAGGDARPTHVSVRLRRATPGVRVLGVGLQADPALALFGEASNRVPDSVGVPAPHVVTADVRVARVSNVAAYFDDPDGDELELAATSSDREVVDATVSEGNLEFRPRREGSATVTLTAMDPAGLRAWQDVPVTVEPGADPDGYDISLVVLNPHYEMHNEQIRQAADHLSTVVVGDLPDEDYSHDVVADPLASWPEVFVGILDDVRVLVDVGRVAHSGGGYTRRDTSGATIVGGISINVRTDDPDRLFTTGLHEMMHVLGIGQGPLWGLWVRDPLFGAQGPADTYFAGTLAIEAFDEAGGDAYGGAKVPVENDPWRSQSHWRPSVMGHELMGPYGGVLSAVTIQALADMGYVVDVNRAEPFEIRLPAAGSSQGSVPGVVARAGSRAMGMKSVYQCGKDGVDAELLAEVCHGCWNGLSLRGLGDVRSAGEERTPQ